LLAHCRCDGAREATANFHQQIPSSPSLRAAPYYRVSGVEQ
jgi:hypothetical protein